MLVWLVAAPPLLAQEARPSPMAIDTVVSFDERVDRSGNYDTGLSVDALVSVGLGRGLEAVVWPIVQRLGSGQWNHDVWIASVRYERAGPIGLRVEGGLVPSPVGLANLIVRRPHLNPTVAQPSMLSSAPCPRSNRGATSQSARRLLPVRRTGHAVGAALGRPGCDDRHVPASTAPHSCTDESAQIHERYYRRRRHAGGRGPPDRGIGHARRLDVSGEKLPRLPPTWTAP